MLNVEPLLWAEVGGNRSKMAVVVAAVGDEHHGSTVRANVEPTVACVHSRHVATAKVEVMESQATQTLVVHALKQTTEASAKAQPATREEKKRTSPAVSIFLQVACFL